MVVGGEAIPEELARRLTELEYEDSEDNAAILTLVFDDEDGALVDLDIFAHGVKWAVSIGWRTSLTPFGPFTVSTYGIDCGANGVAQMRVELHDGTHGLRRKAKFRAWASHSIGDVAQSIARENGMGYRIDESSRHIFTDENTQQQAGKSDAGFLSWLGDRFGYRCFVDQGTVVFKTELTNKQGAVKEPPPRTLCWRMGTRDLVSISMQQPSHRKTKTGTGRPKPGAKVCGANVDIGEGTIFDWLYGPDQTIQVNGEDAEQNGEVSAQEEADGKKRRFTMDPVSGKFVEVYEDEAIAAHADTGAETPATEADVEKTLAAAHAGKKADIVKATALMTTPDFEIRRGDPVEVLGVPRRFGGQWRVIGIRLELTPRGWKQTLTLAKRGLGASRDTSKALANAEDPSQAARPDAAETELRYRMDPVTGDLIELEQEKR